MRIATVRLAVARSTRIGTVTLAPGATEQRPDGRHAAHPLPRSASQDARARAVAKGVQAAHPLRSSLATDPRHTRAQRGISHKLWFILPTTFGSPAGSASCTPSAVVDRCGDVVSAFEGNRASSRWPSYDGARPNHQHLEAPRLESFRTSCPETPAGPLPSGWLFAHGAAQHDPWRSRWSVGALPQGAAGCRTLFRVTDCQPSG